jgi:hypothetical protein
MGCERLFTALMSVKSLFEADLKDGSIVLGKLLSISSQRRFQSIPEHRIFTETVGDSAE